MNTVFRFVSGALLTIALVSPATGQSHEETLADIRQEMSFLYVEVQRLRTELSTTGNSQDVSGQGTNLQRLDALEGELRRITGKVEELEFRIKRIVKDGTNRIGDLEFRLVELEGGDVSQLGETTTLGGDGQIRTPVVVTPTDPNLGELAVSEEVDFQAAQAAYDAQDYETAATLFAVFTEAYPGGPLTVQAHYMRGDSLASLEKWSDAARSYLQSFSSAPDSAVAPDALFRLGVSLNKIGQREQACLTLNEVGNRYPQSGAKGRAEAEMFALDCGL